MKKTSFIVFLALLYITGSLIFASQPITLSKLLKPGLISIGKDKIYVTEGASVLIYSLKDFSFLKKFGTQGEGPQEFIVEPFKLRVHPDGDRIVVTSMRKITIYSNDGEFIKEIKGHPRHVLTEPVGDKYVARTSLMENKVEYITMNLYNQKLELVKEIYRIKNIVQQGKDIKILSKMSLFTTGKNKVFIPTKSGDMAIEIFDDEGKFLKIIKADSYKPLKFEKKHIGMVYDIYRKHPLLKQYFASMKSRFRFPEYFPAIYGCNVDNEKIYALTYRRKKNTNQFVIFNTKDKSYKLAYLPIAWRNLMDAHPFTIKNGKIYQLIENEASEEWELHVTPIKTK